MRSHCRAILSCGCAGSIHSRFASGGKSSFFFQPVQLHLELPDLLVELRLERLLVLLPLRPARGEKLWHLLLQAMFPMRNLRRMHPISTGEFIDRFESFKRFECHTGFELSAVLFPLCRHLPLPPLPFLLTQPSILITCPVVRIGRTLQSFPPSKRSGRLSTHSAFQLGLWTLEEQTRRHRRRGAPVSKDRHLLSPLHPFASLLTGLP